MLSRLQKTYVFYVRQWPQDRHADQKHRFEELSETAYSYKPDILEVDQSEALELSLLAIFRKPFHSLCSWNDSSRLWSHHLKPTGLPHHTARRKTVSGFSCPANRATSQSCVPGSPDAGSLATLIICSGYEGWEAGVPYQAVYLTLVTSKIRTALAEKASHL